MNGLANRKIYLAFNFEAHFGVPTVRGLNDLLFWQKVNNESDECDP